MSINARELRIGNIAIYHSAEDGDMPCRLDAQDIFNIATGYMENDKIHSPLNLSPEILIACGFEKRRHKLSLIEYVDYRLGNMVCSIIQGAVEVEFCGLDIEERAYLTAVKHLHQLQNLYWCLCGEELPINEEKLKQSI